MNFAVVEGGCQVTIILSQNDVEMVIKEFMITRETIADLQRMSERKVGDFAGGFVRCWSLNLANLLTKITRGEILNLKNV